MGIMDSIKEAIGGNAGSPGIGDNAKVAGGLLDTLREQPGGVSGMFQSLQQNGMGGAVQQWAGGQTAPASPDQIQQGLGGTGIIDTVAQRTGLSPTMVKGAMAVMVPMIIHHFVANGHVTPDGQPTGAPMPEQGGMLQSILSRIG